MWNLLILSSILAGRRCTRVVFDLIEMPVEASSCCTIDIHRYPRDSLKLGSLLSSFAFTLSIIPLTNRPGNKLPIQEVSHMISDKK